MRKRRKCRRRKRRQGVTFDLIIYTFGLFFSKMLLHAISDPQIIHAPFPELLENSVKVHLTHWEHSGFRESRTFLIALAQIGACFRVSTHARRSRNLVSYLDLGIATNGKDPFSRKNLHEACCNQIRYVDAFPSFTRTFCSHVRHKKAV